MRKFTESLGRDIFEHEEETYEIVTTDNKRVFGIPTEKTYEFMEISREVQDKIEALGYTYLLSMRDSEYDIMILEGKFK